MSTFWQATIDGVGSGSIYALVALGYVVIFRACGVVNLCLVETGMVGTYLTTTLIAVGLHPWHALVVGLTAAGLVGVLTYVAVLQGAVEQNHLVAVLITLGLALALRSLIAILFGTQERSLRIGIERTSWFIGDLVVWQLHVVAFGVALAAVCSIGATMKWTRAGRAARALTEDQPVARLAGIRATRAFAAAFAVAGILAAIAVVLNTHAGFLSQGTAHLGIRALPAAVIGGFDSIKGALVGGLVLGFSEQLVATFIAGDLAEFTPFVLLLVVLIVRPAGLFGTLRLRRV